jgi:hypothetical protein
MKPEPETEMGSRVGHSALRRQWPLLSFAALFTLGYVSLHAAGLFVFGERMTGLEVVIFVAPVLTLPIFFLVLWSLPAASALMWVNFLTLHIAYVASDWPHVSDALTALQTDWPLLLIAVLIQWAVLREQTSFATPKSSGGVL